MTKAVKNRILYQLNFLKTIGYDYHSTIKFTNKEVSSNSLPNDMEELKNVVENCYLCELSKSRKNVLFGEGNLNASLMLIADEPTASEDELKSFYVGKTGEQLVKMIENVLPLKKEDVYITNLVKCKSSNGINASAYNSCSTYLHKQIELVEPKLIVTFGEKAYQYLCNDNTSFNKIRGQVMHFKEYQVVPTHSVSYLLRNPSSKKEAFYDMLKIKSILELN
ncbi:uracil-DNA glycosylase [Arcobacter sp. LA11]|uniref:uracil-DNA glycosylase n=1 Tax=Arcobacter sp. LA11 TaxID=1898176 RepID=UPI000932A6EA|nr:uracil-DNA glycosylase [Arcobacter sp. LA11]